VPRQQVRALGDILVATRGRLRAPLIALLGLLAVGTLGYRAVEGWSWLDSAWMVAITVTTIGFGEVHPLSSAGRAFTMVLIVAGVGVAGWAISDATGYALSGEARRDILARRLRRRVNALSGHFIVVGYGRTGREVAADLAHAGAQVVVIDPSATVCEAARAEGLLVVEGDGSRDAVLRAAGVERAQGLAATSASDAVNVFVALTARRLSQSLRILARLDDEENEDKARTAGADDVVRPHAIGGTTLANGLLRPGSAAFVAQALARGDHALSVEDVVAKGPALVGRLGDLHLRQRYGIMVVAVHRAVGGLVPTPGADEWVGEGDVLVVIGSAEAVARVRRLRP
jgi:voltage-gated potassium channel